MPAPKKILVLCVGSYISGAENVTLEVLEYLQQKGHQVHCMVNGWNDGKFIERLNQLGIPYTLQKLGWYYLRKPGWTLGSMLRFPGAILTFIRLKATFRPDVYYAVSYRTIFLQCLFFNRNVIYHVHDTNGDNRQGRFFLKLIQPFVKKFIAVSEFIKTDLIQCGVPATKIEVVYNWVKPDLIHQEAILNRMYMPDGLLRIGIAGQVSARKGHTDLFKALSIINQNINFECLVFGNNEYAISLKQELAGKAIEKRIRWMGYEGDKFKLYNSIDVLVAPAIKTESFGLVVAEAGMYGICSIVTGLGGVKEIINDSETGFIVPKNSPNAIAQKIQSLYEQPQQLLQMGRQARERVLEKFPYRNIEQVAAAITGI
jgi:glycosyltransferase involved in cell wall biosynthesis